MGLKLKIEGESDVVREFIACLKTNERYFSYQHAKYLFLLKLVSGGVWFAGRDTGGAETDAPIREGAS
jgi:hypothetical protein